MLRIKFLDGRLGIILAISAAFLMTGGCAQFHSDPPLADNSTVSATAAPEPMPSDALAQTMVMPGTAPAVNSPAVPAHMALTVPAIAPPPLNPGVTTIPVGANTAVAAEVKRFIFHSPEEERRYDAAAAKFPGFCNEWARMLRDRESNNLDHLVWVTHDGVESSTYTGYGQIDSCETKESVEGVPIGKLSYMEMIYDLEGKTPEQARQTPPKVIHQVHTLEIFSWDNNKWFY
jgi:hypothetical protein